MRQHSGEGRQASTIIEVDTEVDYWKKESCLNVVNLKYKLCKAMIEGKA